MIVIAALAAMGLAGGAGLLLSGLRGESYTSRRRCHRPPTSHRVETSRLAVAASAAVLALLVSRWPVAAVAAGVAAWWVPLPGRRVASQQAEARAAALAQWCASLRDAAGTARGIEGILVATAPAAPAPIRAEIARMAARLEHQRLDVALDQLARDLDHPTGDLAVTALRLAATAGSRRIRQVLGDLATAAELEAGMRRRVDVARQRPRTTIRLVAVIEAVFLTGLVLFSRDYLDPYGTALGQTVLALLAVYSAAGFWWMARLGRLPHPQRFLTRPATGASP